MPAILPISELKLKAESALQTPEDHTSYSVYLKEEEFGGILCVQHGDGTGAFWLFRDIPDKFNDINSIREYIDNNVYNSKPSTYFDPLAFESKASALAVIELLKKSKDRVYIQKTKEKN